MRRFFVEGLKEDDRSVEVNGEEFLHLKKVLRLGRGDDVSVFGATGFELLGSIDELGNKSAKVKVTGIKKDAPPAFGLILLQGMIKNSKPELVIQKATELGATALKFYPSSRTVREMQPEKKEARLERWRRVAIEAAKQCNRNSIPDILFLNDFREALQGSGVKLMLLEGGKRLKFKGALRIKKPFDSITVLIGPEGGFTEDEAKAAVESGFTPVDAGPRTMRAETAAIAALSIVQYEMGDIGN